VEGRLAVSDPEFSESRKRYAQLKPFYRRLASEVVHTLRERLRGANLEPVTVTNAPMESFFHTLL
jgi:hypothetical protein